MEIHNRENIKKKKTENDSQNPWNLLMDWNPLQIFVSKAQVKFVLQIKEKNMSKHLPSNSHNILRKETVNKTFAGGKKKKVF